MKRGGVQARYLTLADRTIHPCKGCDACQEFSGGYCVGGSDRAGHPHLRLVLRRTDEKSPGPALRPE